MSELARALDEAGGTAAPATATAHLRTRLIAELARGSMELELARSGYGEPVEVAIGYDTDRLLAAAPVDPSLRADPERASERAWLLVAAAVGALVELSEPYDDERNVIDLLEVTAGELESHLILALPSCASYEPAGFEDLVPLAFDEHAGGIDRLRARALAVPGVLLSDTVTRAPVGAAHPLRIAELIARLGGHPADARSVSEHEDAAFELLEPQATSRPHEDPDPALRIARRILQRLRGMGKWGGYHTDVAHLSRGFAGNERALAVELGQALIDAGLLKEKLSVGQRHVYLDPRRAADIHGLIDEGRKPAGLAL